MNLLNGEIYVFLVVFFLSLVMITLYDIFKPEKEFIKNFVPFPKISPKNIPGPDMSMQLLSDEELSDG